MNSMATVRLASTVDVDGLLEGKTFEDDVIEGPAVIGLLNDIEIVDSRFDINVAGAFIEVPEGQAIAGVVIARDTRFRRCRFVNIAFIGTANDMAALKIKLGA